MKSRENLFGELFQEESRLIYDIAMVYSKLLDRGKDKEAQEFLKKIDSRTDKKHLKKLRDMLVSFADKNSITIPGLSTEDVIIYGKPFLDSLFVSSQKIEAQLELFGIDDRQNVEIHLKSGLDGLDLDLYQERVLDGILYRFSELGYPRYIEITESEFYELAGAERLLTRRGRHEFPGYESEKLKSSLKKLDETKYPIILKKYAGYDKKTKRRHFEVARFHKSLIDLVWFYKGVDEDTLLQFEKEQSNNNGENQLKQHFSHWRIYLNELVMEDAQNSFRVLPHNIYRKIKEHRQLKHANTSKRMRITQAEIMFVKWLHKHGGGKEEIRINWQNLASDLKLSGLIERREHKKLRSILTGLYHLAQDLGYLIEFSVNEKSLFTKDKTVDVLRLNPEKFYHLQPTRGREGGLPLKNARSTTKKCKVYH